MITKNGEGIVEDEKKRREKRISELDLEGVQCSQN